MKARFVLTTMVLVLLISLAPGADAGRLYVEKDKDASMGWPTEISIYADSLDTDLTGFDILLALNETEMDLMKVRPGATIDTCGWDYFTYKVIRDTLGIYDLGKATELLEITGFGNPSVGCSDPDAIHELARLNMLVSTRSYNDCMFLPVYFYWRDCNDNVLFTGPDTVLVVESAYRETYPYDSSRNQPFPGYGPPDSTCTTFPAVVALRSLKAITGGADLACVGRSMMVGDLNLDQFHYAAADAILYISYFLRGIIVFDQYPDAQIVQSDINRDGYPLTVADMILLTNIVIGDQFPPLKIGGEKLSANVAVERDSENTCVTVTPATEVAGLWLRFDSPCGGTITADTDLIMTGTFDREPTVLMIDTAKVRPVIRAGETVTFRISDPQAHVSFLDIVGLSGASLKLVESRPLPAEFTLYQNYPNPFNPSTEISFFLPEETKWRLQIFDILGRQVESFSGHSEGANSVTWDASESSSGIYLYRLETETDQQTRRMMLLK